MKRKILSAIITLCMVVTLIPCFTGNVNAASAAAIDKTTALSRVTQLQQLSGYYFTNNGQRCPNTNDVHHSNSYCTNCNPKAVMLNNSNVKSLIKKYKGYNIDSSFNFSNLPWSATCSDSCFGFANFAMWYVFSNNKTDKVSYSTYKTATFNSRNMHGIAKPGDVIRLNDSHSAMVISTTSTGVRVIQSNWGTGNDYQANRISVDTINYNNSYYSNKKLIIYRAKNYNPNLASISKASVSLSSYTYKYDGKLKYPAVTVKYGSTTLKKDMHYTVSYSNNKYVGTATVKITGKGNYTGYVSKSFTIVPGSTYITKITATKKLSNRYLTVYWKKQATQTTGYIVQLYNTKTGKYSSYATKDNTQTSIKLPVNKKIKYKVRIRTYKTVNGKSYLSSYSSWKTATSK